MDGWRELLLAVAVLAVVLAFITLWLMILLAVLPW